MLGPEQSGPGSTLREKYLYASCDSDRDCYHCKQTLSDWIQRRSESTCRQLHDESIHNLKSAAMITFSGGQIILVFILGSARDREREKTYCLSGDAT